MGAAATPNTRPSKISPSSFFWIRFCGLNPKYRGFNGASEFRALTQEELESAIELINKYRVNQ